MAKAVFFSTAVTVAAFVPLFTMQGVEGQIFNPMARTYGYALLGALLATFTVRHQSWPPTFCQTISRKATRFSSEPCTPFIAQFCAGR